MMSCTLPRRPPHAVAGGTRARPAARPAAAVQGRSLGCSGARHGCAGHRHRREHRDVRGAGRRRAPTPSVRAGGAPRRRVEDQPHRPGALQRALLSGVPGVAGAVDELREPGRPAHHRLRVQLRPDRPRRSGRRRERTRHERILRGARRAADARPHLHGEGRPGRSPADSGTHPRVLDERPRCGPRSDRNRRVAHGRRLHGDRRSARRIRLSTGRRRLHGARHPARTGEQPDGVPEGGRAPAPGRVARTGDRRARRDRVATAGATPGLDCR